MAERIQGKSRDVRRSKRSRLRLMIGGIMAGVMLSAGAGCSTLTRMAESINHTECIDDFMVSHRNHAWAARAWHREKIHHGDRQHLADFRRGFFDGYADVAEGGAGCTPAIAPKEYWGWKYQSAEGRAKVAAWFAGFPLGAAAAEQDGLGNLAHLPTNLPQQVKMPRYEGDGSMPGPHGPVPIVPIGSEFAPTAADALRPNDADGSLVPNALDWSAVDMVPENVPAVEAP